MAIQSAPRTNTLHLILPHPFLFTPPLQTLFKSHFEAYGLIHTWAPIKSFGRVIIVYYEDAVAEAAKRGADRMRIGGTNDEGKGVDSGSFFKNDEMADDSAESLEVKDENPTFTLRLFRAHPTEIEPTEDNHLQAPGSAKNFLISPPGSPPEGWEPIEEDPPNSATLADDLIKALEEASLKHTGRGTPGEEEIVIDTSANKEGHLGRPLPSVSVIDTTPVNEMEDDTEDVEVVEELKTPGGRSAWTQPSQLSGIGSIRATVESMGGTRTPGGSLIDPLGRDAVRGKIVPTGMPPMQRQE